jgi:hypothetical protein
VNLAGLRSDPIGFLLANAMPLLLRIARAFLYAVVGYILTRSQSYYAISPASIALVIFILAGFRRLRVVAEIVLAFLLVLVFLPHELVAKIAARL